MNVSGQGEKKAVPRQLLPGLPSLVSTGKRTKARPARSIICTVGHWKTLETLLIYRLCCAAQVSVLYLCNVDIIEVEGYITLSLC